MDELTNLYQTLVLDHSKNPRNRYAMQDANTNVEAFNPICGDKIKIFIKANNKILEKISYTAQACSISLATCSMMSQIMAEKSFNEALNLIDKFHKMLTEENEIKINASAELKSLSVMKNVRKFPMRIKCATMPIHALKDCINQLNF